MKSKGGNYQVFIKNVNKLTPDSAVLDEFGKYGTISNFLRPEKFFLGYVFLSYKDPRGTRSCARWVPVFSQLFFFFF